MGPRQPETPPAVEAAEKRKERLAVNIFDLDRLSPLVRGKLFRDGEGDRIDLTHAVRVGPEKDEAAVVFTCPLLTAATVCDILRSNDRKFNQEIRERGLKGHEERQTRVYLFRGRSWVPVPRDVILTRQTPDKQVILNPNVFPLKPTFVEPVPLEAEAVDIS
jgi:hypothetical protein